MPFNYPILTPNWKQLIISSNLSSAMPLVFGTLTTLKKDFHRSKYKNGEDIDCPLQMLAFLQPTTVDKEPKNHLLRQIFLVSIDS